MSSPISGFTAIPNPQMLAFMPIQSYLMMYFAGSGWQYGKRKISAMSNEQFNKLTPEELLQKHSIELKNMLPTLEKTLKDVTPLIKILIEQYGEFIVEAIRVTPKVAQTTGFDIGTEILKGLGTTREATGINPTQFQALAYAKFLLEQEAHKAGHVTPPSLGLSTGQERRSTVPGRTVAQAQQEARDKQIAFEKEQEAKRRASQVLATQIKRTAPPPTVPSRGIVSRPSNISCQSLRIERSFLLKTIKDLTNDLRRLPPHLRSNTVANLQQSQQRMVDFISRHRIRLKQCGM